MDQNLFANTPSVISERCIYTPSAWAKSTLLYLQEAGTLRAVRAHTSTRSNLRSYLCFVVTSGFGELVYDGRRYELKRLRVYRLSEAVQPQHGQGLMDIILVPLLRIHSSCGLREISGERGTAGIFHDRHDCPHGPD